MTLSKLKSLIFKASENPQRLTWTILQFIASIFTIILAMVQLYELAGPLITWPVGVILSLAFVVPPLISLRADLNRRFGIEQQNSYVLANCAQKWHVLENGSRKIIIEREMLIYKPPAAHELVDVVIGSEKLSWPELEFESLTSTIVSHTIPKPDHHHIRWKPKEPLYPGDKYTHVISLSYPNPVEPFKKSFTIGTITPCRKFSLEITTERDIVHIASERTFGDEKLDDAMSIFMKPVLSTTQLLKSWEKRRVLFEAENLTYGERYIVRIYLKGTNIKSQDLSVKGLDFVTR